MSFIEQYISDNFEETGKLLSLSKQIEQLGFDIRNDPPSTFSHFQITEGFDIYEELRQSLQINSIVNNKTAMVSFVFRAIRDEESTDFRLIDIEARLYIIDLDRSQETGEKYFGGITGFPSKDQMVKEMVNAAISLERARTVKQKLGVIAVGQTNKNISNGRTFRP